ncbi:MAG TPA: YceD family protein [Sideroxyarcus sp.]|nr:YceD family protein [Sideroxyarcus sp.]
MRGEIAVAELARLADLLARPDGMLVYIVRGYREDDREMLEVSLQGRCILKCQRCLGEMDYPVAVTSRLRLLSSDVMDEIEEDDEVDAIEADPRLDVVALIEEELLLGMPFAPKHPEGECAPATNDLQQKANPFAVLARLKK